MDFATLIDRRTADNQVLILRTCDTNLRSHGGFQWPITGPVEAPDWKRTAACGNGLHGLLWGCGSVDYLNLGEDAVWLVVAADPADVVDIDGDKVKFRAGEVLHAGSRHDAVARITAEPAASGLPIVFATATAGDRGTATAGDRGTATAGDWGTATAGDWGVLIFTWWDSTNQRYRTKCFEVGENGVEANTAYKLHITSDGPALVKAEVPA